MRKRTILVLAILSISLAPAASAAPKPLAGKACSKVGATSIVKKEKLTCIASGKKKIWSKPINTSLASVKPPVSPAQANSSQTNYAGIQIYSGGPGSNVSIYNSKSFDLPRPVVPAPVGTNGLFWIYDPANQSASYNSPGFWYSKTDTDWTWAGANSDGSLYLTLQEGSYTFDVVETNVREYVRKRYLGTVDATKKLTIENLLPNSQGFFTVTVDLVKSRAKTVFTPTNKCQLSDQTKNTQGQVGFPQALGRLPTSGAIKALIVPVDFSDVPGKGIPATEYAGMMSGMHDFYAKMSGNRVSFDVKTLKDWVRMPVLSTFHKLGSWNQGDISAYWKLALKTADPLVDYSLFDVVYVLSPKEIPWSSIAYGPAGPMNIDSLEMNTNDGPVLNITNSGADAWQNVSTGSTWKWIAHETGHLFGLHDLYVNPGPHVYGSWDLMSNNWSNSAIEINAWNRYLLGWITDSQVTCLDANELTPSSVDKLIDPIERINSLPKSVIVRLSDSKIIVIESRRNEGLDRLNPEEEGTLVYTVDMTIPSIKGGWKVQRRPGSVKPFFEDAALHQGDVITVEGVRIEIISRDQSGDTVRISKP